MINNHLKPAILIQVYNANLEEYDLKEMQGLAKTAGYTIFSILTQRLNHLNSSLFLGRGKVKAIRNSIDLHFEIPHKPMEEEEMQENYGFEEDLFLDEHENKSQENEDEVIIFTDFPNDLKYRHDLTIIFNNRIGYGQGLNLRKEWDCKVIDRDELVLEIFENNASTRESKLQIELARITLQTNIIKKEMGQHLSEKQGRDFKGKGMKAWEPKMRAFRGRRKEITDQLEKIAKQRDLRRKKRQKYFNVGIVGYTNAGKSTLLNKLAKVQVETANQEFTTVSPISRKVVFHKYDQNGSWAGEEVIFTDSVGFITDMSNVLLRAFLSTLEELQFANILVIILDISDTIDRIILKLTTSFNIIKQIGVESLPRILVLNKIDQETPEEIQKKIDIILPQFPDNKYVKISALEKQGFEELGQLIIEAKNKRFHL